MSPPSAHPEWIVALNEESMTNPAPATASAPTKHPIEAFLARCDKLGLAPQAARHPTLVAAITAQSHETVLFFLCGRDYIYHPTDLKLQGIESLFIGAGTPFELNIGSGVADDVKDMLHAPGVTVRTEIGTPHAIGVYDRSAGIRAGGAGNYNLGTKAITRAFQGLRGQFLRDMESAVNEAKIGKLAGALKDERVFGYLQTLRNATRRFWVYDMPEIGL
jgi:hypothetical protein